MPVKLKNTTDTKINLQNKYFLEPNQSGVEISDRDFKVLRPSLDFFGITYEVVSGELPPVVPPEVDFETSKIAKFVANALSLEAGHKFELTAVLTDKAEVPVPNREISFADGSESHNVVTDIEGSASVAVVKNVVGEYTITATHNDSTKTLTLKVIPNLTSVDLKDVAIDKDSIKGDGETKFTITGSVSDQFGNAIVGEAVTFASSEATLEAESVLTNDNGEFTVQGTSIVAGANKVSIRYADKTQDVKFSALVSTTGIEITGSTEVVCDKTSQLALNFIPENTTDRQVEWASSDESIATVDQTGLVTTLKVGSTKITATLKSDTSVVGSVDFKVLDVLVTQVIVKGDSEGTVGDKITLTYEVSPANSTEGSVTWSSSNSALATVTKAGVVTLKNVGDVVITATSNDSGKVAGTKRIEIKAAPEQEETAK